MRLVVLTCLLTALAVQQESPPFTEAQWRRWFLERGFGTDPYFFFPRGESGTTDCPEAVRLTLLRVDSTAVELGVDPDQLLFDDQPSFCRVPYHLLRGRAEQAPIEPGRRLWRLRAEKQ